MDEIIILDEFPEYYIKIAARYIEYDFKRPDILIEVDFKRQYYIRKKDIPYIMLGRIHYSSKDGTGMTALILVDFYHGFLNKILSEADFDLFVKFDSKSEMIKWKLKNG